MIVWMLLPPGDVILGKQHWQCCLDERAGLALLKSPEIIETIEITWNFEIIEINWKYWNQLKILKSPENYWNYWNNLKQTFTSLHLQSKRCRKQNSVQNSCKYFSWKGPCDSCWFVMKFENSFWLFPEQKSRFMGKFDFCCWKFVCQHIWRPRPLPPRASKPLCLFLPP